MINYLEYKESNSLEAKKAKDKLPKSIYKTYSAFANSDGGLILLGFSEDEEKNLFISAVNDASKLIDELWSSLNNPEKVSHNILTDKDIIIKTEKGLNYIEIYIPRAQNHLRPIYLNNNMQNCYKRNHTGDYKCSIEEIRAMVRDQVDNIDAKVLNNFSFADLSSDSITAYRNMFKSLKENHVWNKLSDIEFLEKIRALEFVDEVPRPTVAGLLFFGYDYRIMSYYPLYFLDYQEKMTDNVNVRYTNRIHTGTGDSSGNIFDFYSRVVGRLLLDIELPFKLKENSIQRESESEMHVAVREALANCLTNADFTFPRGLVIKKTYTQMTFENPGSLRVSVEQAFKGGISDPRNSLILHMFNQIGIGEKAGSGIPTIKQAFEENGFVDPVLYEEFSPNRTFLKLSFVKREKHKEIVSSASIEKEYKSLNKQELEIVKCLKENGEVRRIEVEKLLGVGERRASYLLNKLERSAVIIKLGSTKSARYKLS